MINWNSADNPPDDDRWCLVIEGKAFYQAQYHQHWKKFVTLKNEVIGFKYWCDLNDILRTLPLEDK